VRWAAPDEDGKDDSGGDGPAKKLASLATLLQ
jgi:hypothetical protein